MPGHKSCLYKECKSDSRKDRNLRWAPFIKPSRGGMDRTLLWIERLGRAEYAPEHISKYHYVCENHFPANCDLNYRTNLTLTPLAWGEPRGECTSEACMASAAKNQSKDYSF